MFNNNFFLIMDVSIVSLLAFARVHNHKVPRDCTDHRALRRRTVCIDAGVCTTPRRQGTSQEIARAVRCHEPDLCRVKLVLINSYLSAVLFLLCFVWVIESSPSKSSGILNT